VKTRADLLLRDSLAASFVAAAGGDDEAGERIDALHAWARGAGSGGMAATLESFETERGTRLFDSDGSLLGDFATHAEHVRDRALRMHAALGWLREAQALGQLIECARAAWDAGLFFEVHELLEPTWLREEGPRKTALQGLILAGAGLYHFTRENLAGSSGLLRDAERHIERSPRLDSLDLVDFGRRLGDLGRRIASGELRHWSQLDTLPRF